MKRKKLIVILVSIISANLVLVAAAVVFIQLSSKDHRVSEGAAYGFVIGESAAETYQRALSLQARGQVREFRLGQGSAAFVLDASMHDATTYPSWKLVVDPNWWNNAINLTFEKGELVEIWRFRLCCEMP